MKNLATKFDSNTVLDRMDLKISARECFVLLGPSASGKYYIFSNCMPESLAICSRLPRCRP